MILVAVAAGLFVLLGVLLLVRRDDLTRLQAHLAGGTMVPGCVVAEAVLMFLLAALVLWGWSKGAFGR